MAVVTLENAGRTYDGRPVIEGVTLAVPKGSCLALIGHNGAGKTTLMKQILGLARPTSGSVSVLGVDPANARKAFRRQLGFLPENVAFHKNPRAPIRLLSMRGSRGSRPETVRHFWSASGSPSLPLAGLRPIRRVCANGLGSPRPC